MPAMVGIKRSKGAHRAAYAEAWEATEDLDDLALPDGEFIPAETWGEARAELEARHAPPDPDLFRVEEQPHDAGYYEVDASGYRRYRTRTVPRLLVLRGWYWRHANQYVDAARLAALESLARNYGPILLKRDAVGGRHGKSALERIRGWDGYHECDLVARAYLDGPEDRVYDPVVAYAPKRANARRKGSETSSRRQRREARVAGAINSLDNRVARFAKELLAGANAALAEHLRRTKLAPLGAHALREGVPAPDDAARPFVGQLAGRCGVYVEVRRHLDTGWRIALEVHKAVVGRRAYRKLDAWAALVDFWRRWPADVVRGVIPRDRAELVAFLDAERAADDAAKKREARRAARDRAAEEAAVAAIVAAGRASYIPRPPEAAVASSTAP